MLFEDGGLTAFNQALHCSELLSSIYTAHYQHVLQVCRRFFHRPEDAEDAAAEVFLKLHTVLPKKDNEHPFRPWVCQVAGRHASINCAAGSARKTRSLWEAILASCRMLPAPLRFRKFCAKKQTASCGNI
jgi:DNA-directed RNA polymerase specialized sigma24 family protein